MLINLTNGDKIDSRDDRYLMPAQARQDECGQPAPEWPYYRCTRPAGHEETDKLYPHTHAAHGSYRGSMFAVWQDGEE